MGEKELGKEMSVVAGPAVWLSRSDRCENPCFNTYNHG